MRHDSTSMSNRFSKVIQFAKVHELSTVSASAAADCVSYFENGAIKSSTVLDIRNGMKMIAQHVATADAILACGLTGYQGGSRPAKMFTMYTKASSKERSLSASSVGFSNEKSTVEDTTTVPRSDKITARICWLSGTSLAVPARTASKSEGNASRNKRRKRPICSKSVVRARPGPARNLAGMASTGRQLARSSAPLPVNIHPTSKSLVQKSSMNFTKNETLTMSST
mmetsp:Transcript_127666/g.272205  ORF Transcript_127666/g.272205 Transcript_127666/m.272205 type:complete len:226 (-) Transcript_127666:526-1203(-)